MSPPRSSLPSTTPLLLAPAPSSASRPTDASLCCLPPRPSASCPTAPRPPTGPTSARRRCTRPRPCAGSSSDRASSWRTSSRHLHSPSCGRSSRSRLRSTRPRKRTSSSGARTSLARWSSASSRWRVAEGSFVWTEGRATTVFIPLALPKTPLTVETGRWVYDPPRAQSPSARHHCPDAASGARRELPALDDLRQPVHEPQEGQPVVRDADAPAHLEDVADRAFGCEQDARCL